MTKQEPDQYILKRKKKRRKIILTILLSLLIVAGLFILKIILICTAKPTISVDYAVELNRITKPKNYDPNKNAAFNYQKAAEAFISRPPLHYTQGEESFDALSDAQQEALEKWITDDNQALAHLERGSKKPYLWLQAQSVERYDPEQRLWRIIDYKFDMVPVDQLIQALGWRAKFAISNGQPERALDDILTMYGVGSHVASQNIRPDVGWLMQNRAAQISLDWLANEEVDPALLAEFQIRLEKEISPIDTVTVPFIERHRIQHLNMIQHVFTDDGKGSGHLIPKGHAIRLIGEYLSSEERYSGRNDGILSEIFDFRNAPTKLDTRIEALQIAMFGPDRRQVTSAVNKYFDYVKTLADKTPWQLKQTGFEQNMGTFGGKPAQIVTRAYSPILEHILINARIRRYRMSGAVLVKILAIQRYKVDKGQPPDNLQQLVDSGYLKKLPMDPYSSGPLVYKRNGQTFILYSFGPDFDDDGGSKGPKLQSPGSPTFDLILWPVEGASPNE